VQLSAKLLADATKLIQPTLTAIGRGSDRLVVLKMDGCRVPVPDGDLRCFASTFSKADVPVWMVPLGEPSDEMEGLVEGVLLQWHTGKMEPRADRGARETRSGYMRLVEFDFDELLRLARSDEPAVRKAEALVKRLLEDNEELSEESKALREEQKRKQLETCHKYAIALACACSDADWGDIFSSEKKLQSAMRKLAKEHGVDYRQRIRQIDVDGLSGDQLELRGRIIRVLDHLDLATRDTPAFVAAVVGRDQQEVTA
jgi:hypothetical protein